MDAHALTLLLTTALVAAVSRGQSAPESRPASVPVGIPPAPVVRLWPGDPPATGPFDATDDVTDHGQPGLPQLQVKAVRSPTLSVYVPRVAAGRPTAAVVVCPGGGYATESFTHEGTEVAATLAGRGVAAFVLKYRLPDGHAPAAGELPVSQQDVLRAVQLVRAGAAEWNVDPARVGVMGFSAGGHLAATAATLYDQAPSLADKAGRDAAGGASARPDFAVLVYPVISMRPGVTHGGSRDNLIGKAADAATEARFSPALHVTAKTPPLFVTHAVDDGVVPVDNARLMDAAAAAAGVPHELLVLSHGGHGFGLGHDAETRRWFDASLAWLAAQKLVDLTP